MKRQGILNSDISRVLSYMGHTDTICIGDCGLPIPDETERIDLAVKFGQPSFMDVLEEVGADMKVEKIILAEEMKLQNPEILRQIEQFFAKHETGFKPEIQFVLHSDLKKMTKHARQLFEPERQRLMQILFYSRVVFSKRGEQLMEIEMRGINKSFGNNAVLNNAGFVLSTGEIHALMGENGAGKSTLMEDFDRCLYKRCGAGDRGRNRKSATKMPEKQKKAGIVFIHQELNVLFDLTVEENMFLGKEIKKKCGVCDKKAMRREVEKILKRLGVEIDPGQRMEELSVGQQQMVEIAKALMVNAKVIIMDEPTAALTQSETRVLFEAANALRERGVSIVYISHRMEEIFELCDRITILRDGTYIDTKKISETDMNDVVKMMIRREIGERYPQRNVSIGNRVLEVKKSDLSGRI